MSDPCGMVESYQERIGLQSKIMYGLQQKVNECQKQEGFCSYYERGLVDAIIELDRLKRNLDQESLRCSGLRKWGNTVA